MTRCVLRGPSWHRRFGYRSKQGVVQVESCNVNEHHFTGCQAKSKLCLEAIYSYRVYSVSSRFRQTCHVSGQASLACEGQTHRPHCAWESATWSQIIKFLLVVYAAPNTLQHVNSLIQALIQASAAYRYPTSISDRINTSHRLTTTATLVAPLHIHIRVRDVSRLRHRLPERNRTWEKRRAESIPATCRSQSCGLPTKWQPCCRSTFNPIRKYTFTIWRYPSAARRLFPTTSATTNSSYAP